MNLKQILKPSFEKKYADLSFFFLRIIFGFEMAFYGLSKTYDFSENANGDFWNLDVNFLGLGGSISLGLVIFSELFCSIFVILGLIHKIALIPLIFTMFYIVAILDKFEILYFEENSINISSSFKFLVFYVILYLTGPGKYSLDYFIFRKK